ncbi:hypothetical protein HanIR_Chr03g0144111 [Helianthus annuus]|nr:hypothetical protein HanIR_Chr03g0144111 [Helianthus annuus]
MRKQQMICKLQMLDLRSSENKTDFQAGFLGTKVSCHIQNIIKQTIFNQREEAPGGGLGLLYMN